MRVLSAEFLISATGPREGKGWPEEGPPEIAFAGRSNVGKSTLLAALAQRKGLVRTSSTPGRTRLINFFDLVLAPDSGGRIEARFVDLPGYGYAKVSKAERKEWFGFVERYLGHRATLRAVVLLVDARRVVDLGGAREASPALIEETELARWLAGRGVQVIPVLTKADKLAKHERKPAAERAQAALGARPIIVSANTGDGVDALWRRLGVALAGASV